MPSPGQRGMLVRTGTFATFRCAQSPRCGFLESPVVFYTLASRRKSAAHHGELPPSAGHVRQSLFSGGSATWIFRALPRPTT